MIKEFAGMTLEDAVMKTNESFSKCQKTGTFAGLMREYYISLGANAPDCLATVSPVIALNPDDFETDVDGYVALLAVFLASMRNT